MKLIVFTIALFFCVFVQGCYSGFSVVQVGGGKIVEYEALRSLQSGSLSTVWYRGSSENFHHFQHFIKTSTKYRVRKEKLEIEEEFPLGTKKSIHLSELEK